MTPRLPITFRTRLTRPLLVAGCLALGGMIQPSSRAQSLEEPPTRRAEPVVDDETTPAIPEAPPIPEGTVPRAEPVSDEPAPPARDTPIEETTETTKPATKPGTKPGPKTKTKPAAPKKAVNVPAPEQNLFDYANMVYGQKAYDLAATQYFQYLTTYPRGAYGQIAMYRLAESQLNLGRTAEAEAVYRQLIQRFTSGDYVANAAYRLGSLAYNQRLFEVAAQDFEIAASQSQQERIRFSAMYYKARAMTELNQPKAAYTEYARLARTKTNNLFWDRALIQLGRADEAASRTKAALKNYLLLAGEGSENELIAEALVKSSRLLKQEGQTAEAAAGYVRVLGLGGEKVIPWRAIARYGLIENYYQASQWTKVIETYASTEAVQLPEEQRPRLWLMVGDAQAKIKQHRRAIDLFMMIDQYFPQSPENAEASYRRLLSLNELKDPSLPAVAEQAIAKIKTVDAESPQIDLARFIVAEHFFSKLVYAQAAAAYKDVRVDKLPENLRQPLLFRRGWASQASGDNPTAITSLGQWIETNPKSPQMPEALAKRGLAHKATADWKNAQTDFEKIIESFPKSPVAELAYEQCALVRGQRKDTEGMITTFKALLEKFPTTRAAAEAHFWIGSGHFELKRYADAVPELIRARERDPKAYERDASLRILLSYYYQSDVTQLGKAVEVERTKDEPTARVPRQVYQFLGLKHYELEEMPQADKYLGLASTPDTPEETDHRVWLALSEARLVNNHWEGAIVASDNFLRKTDLPAPQRAKGMLNKARALFALAKPDEAIPVINEALGLQPEARVQARLRLLRGDIAMSQNDPAHAAAIYVVPSQMFDDEEITPLALWKTIQALEKAGKPTEAAAYQTDLKKRFPKFAPPAEPRPAATS